MINEIIKKNAIKFGVISALFSVFATTIMYVIDLNLFVNMWIGFGLLGIFLVIAMVLLYNTKKDLGGNLSFKDGFTAYFISALIGITISTLFSMLLFNIIDTDARDQISELFIKSQVKMMQKFGAPSASINEAIAQLKENSQFSFKGLITGFFQSLLGSIIFGLILAAFFKTRKTYQE
jgi:uncharacterized membrane protein YccC